MIASVLSETLGLVAFVLVVVHVALHTSLLTCTGAFAVVRVARSLLAKSASLLTKRTPVTGFTGATVDPPAGVAPISGAWLVASAGGFFAAGHGAVTTWLGAVLTPEID